MSEVMIESRPFEQRLESALREGLEKAGIEAQVETQPVEGTRLHRAIVTAAQFIPMSHLERQDLVWRIMDRHFTRDEQLQVSLIYTLTPDELEGK